MDRVTVRAHPNVAVAKYWGKRNEALNLPCTGSISITLGGLNTTASLSRRTAGQDEIRFAGQPAPPREAGRISRFLDLARERATDPSGVSVDLTSDFPVAAGIASSASTFAALATGAAHLFGLGLDTQELSVLARRGSGSAARSIHSGFVEWLAGHASDGHDSYAVQLAPPDHWNLAVLVAVTDRGQKRIGSTEGMAQAVERSPFFAAWTQTHDADLNEIRTAIRERDLARLGTVAEHNCLKMHAVCLGSTPHLLYWKPATVAVIERIRLLRAEGLNAYFTIDAGPQVKVICPAEESVRIADLLAEIPGVTQVLHSFPGEAPAIMEGQ